MATCASCPTEPADGFSCSSRAITTTRPAITPLPDEAQGESIAYAPDGKSFYTVSDAESTPLRDPSHADAVLGAVNVVVATPAPMQVSPI